MSDIAKFPNDAESVPLWIEKLSMLPEHSRGRIKRYIEEGYGLSMSTFYRSIIALDLDEARAGADAENLAAIPSFVEYLENYAPAGSFGSWDALANWTGLPDAREEF